jgi:hypothetical protein
MQYSPTSYTWINRKDFFSALLAPPDPDFSGGADNPGVLNNYAL